MALRMSRVENMMARMREECSVQLATKVIRRDWSVDSGACTSAPVRHSTISDSLCLDRKDTVRWRCLKNAD